MKKNDSFPGCLERCRAGMTAPSRFPKCGRPLLCIPVKILDIVLQRKHGYGNSSYFCDINSMRILTVILLMVHSGLLAQQAEPLLFKEKTHDFGEIPEEGGNADYEFSFTNNSGRAIKIISVQASCG